MSHTYTSLLTHIVFSTRNRAPLITDAIRNDLHAYLGGIVRELRGTALLVGGTKDHVHMLVSLPSEMAIAGCLCIVKANSSRWIHEKWPARRSFSWQAGYGAFSVSESSRPRVLAYIADQERHHAKVSFQDEFLALLRKHGIPYDGRYA